MSWQDNLEQIPHHIWNCWSNATIQVTNPLRTGVLTTQGGQSSARTIILRQVNKDARTLVFHTDFRSPKISHLQNIPKVSFVFYHPESRFQVIARGTASLEHKTSNTREAWNMTPLRSRLNYCTLQAPGAPVVSHEKAWPEGLVVNPTVEACEFGYENFAVVTTMIEQLDWLLLDASGNRRADFQWENNWVGRWVAP